MSTRSREFWEGRYAKAAADGSSLWGAAPNDWVAARAEGLAPARALDVGAGEGRNALWLAERGWRVVATDFSPSAVAGIRRAADERALPLTAVVADATTWRSEEPVDLAVLCYLQLDPERLAAAVARAAEALAPGGVLLGIWHDRADVARGLGGTMTPAIRTTPDETAAAARAAGLTVEHSAQRDRATPAGPACDALLVARAPAT